VTGRREARIRAIADALGDRRLVWFGIRGEDAAALLPIPQFTDSFTITAPLRAGKLETSTSLEELTGRRVDLDAYDIDLDDRPVVGRLRQGVLRSLTHSSAVVTYRPSHFLSAVTFATATSSRSLGLFKDRQTAFEHKPWVETELKATGLRTIPWEYVPTERRFRLEARLQDGPVVVRPSRSSGGVGIAVVRTIDDVPALWQDDAFHLMGVAPYFEKALPLNVNACVYDPETVVIHPVSVQLVGLPGYTTRPFGYCGNDFAAVGHLHRPVLDRIDQDTRRIGRWLGSQGFRGAFGIDYLLDGDTLYFAEVNPRFQGSSRLAAGLAARTGHVDLFLDHLSAFLGLPPAEALTSADWTAEVPPAAQVLSHHIGRGPERRSSLDVPRPPAGGRLALLPEPDVDVDPGAVVYSLEVDRQITTTGFDLLLP
jgi:hypothetical protein